MARVKHIWVIPVVAFTGAVAGWSVRALHDGQSSEVEPPAPMPSKGRHGSYASRTQVEDLRRDRDNLAAEKRALLGSLEKERNVVKSFRFHNSTLKENLRRSSAAVGQFSTTVSSRMNKAIVRNCGSALSGFIPIVGDAADVAATAVDLSEYCQISRQIDELDRRWGTKSNHRRANEACRAVSKEAWRKWPRLRMPW